MVPPGSYVISDIESISLTNGNVNLSIPLASLPPMAGGKLSWTVSAVYNSKLWDVVKAETEAEDPWPAYVNAQPQVSSEGGWLVGGIYSIYQRESHFDYNWHLYSSDDDYNYLRDKQWYKMYLMTPDGATHELRPLTPQNYYHPYTGTREYLLGYYDGYPYSTGQTTSYYSYDGSYIWAVIEADGDWTVYFPDGKRIENVNGDERIFDPNGNSILITTTSESDQVITRFMDERTGRKIDLVTFSQAVPYRQEVRYLTVGGVEKTIDITWDGTQVDFVHYVFTRSCAGSPSPNIDPNTNEHVTAGISVIRSIAFPQTEPPAGSYDGRLKYQFSYNSDAPDFHVNQLYQGCPNIPENPYQQLWASRGMGQLNQMTLPSGAKVEYDFNLDDMNPLAKPEFTADLAREPVVEKRLIYLRWPDLAEETQTWNYIMTGLEARVDNPDGSFIQQNSGPHDLGLKYSGGAGGLAYRIIEFREIW